MLAKASCSGLLNEHKVPLHLHTSNIVVAVLSLEYGNGGDDHRTCRSPHCYDYEGLLKHVFADEILKRGYNHPIVGFEPGARNQRTPDRIAGQVSRLRRCRVDGPCRQSYSLRRIHGQYSSNAAVSCIMDGDLLPRRSRLKFLADVVGAKVVAVKSRRITKNHFTRRCVLTRWTRLNTVVIAIRVNCLLHFASVQPQEPRKTTQLPRI